MGKYVVGRVALHMTAIRVYIPSILPSSPLSKGQAYTKEHELYIVYPLVLLCCFFCPFPSLVG